MATNSAGEASESLRLQLLSELEHITEVEGCATWAQRVLPLKNRPAYGRSGGGSRC